MQTFVALPDPVKIALTGAVVWIVSWLFAQLIAMIPWLQFLEEFKEPLALAIAAALIGWIEAAVPDAYAGIAVAAIQLLLVILAFFGVGQGLKAKGVRLFGTWNPRLK